MTAIGFDAAALVTRALRVADGDLAGLPGLRRLAAEIVVGDDVADVVTCLALVAAEAARAGICAGDFEHWLEELALEGVGELA